MRIAHLIAMMVATASVTACGGSVRGAGAADPRHTVSEELRAGSGAPHTPTARGGGPIDPNASALDELRRTPTAPKGTAPAPTGLSPSDIEPDDTTTPSLATPAPRPGEKPLPPDVGPPPPSPHVTTPRL